MDTLTEFPHLLLCRFLLTDYVRLPTTVISPNDGPATGAISVSGGATSSPGVAANPVLSEWISARTLDRLSRDRERSTIPVNWDSVTTSGRAISASGGSEGTVPEADAEMGLLVGSTKPGFSMETRGFYGKYTELY